MVSNWQKKQKHEGGNEIFAYVILSAGGSVSPKEMFRPFSDDPSSF